MKRVSIGIALVTMIAGGVFAQEYELFGSVEFRGRAAHRKDGDVVIDVDERDTWFSDADLRVEATHRIGFDQVQLVLDHAITARPASAAPGDVGTGGIGSSEANRFTCTHDLYRGYVSFSPVFWFSASVGRRRLDWSKMFSFSVIDALHPRSADGEEAPGFDGIVLAFVLGPNLSIEFAGAMQEAIQSGDNDDARIAACVSTRVAPVDLAFSYVFQPETINRPGVLLSVPMGPIRIAMEAAVEACDPRAEEITYQPLVGIGARYTHTRPVDELIVSGEYTYNGLADANPFTTGATRTLVTSDYAGGFERPGEHYIHAEARYTRLDSWYTTHTVFYNASDESTLVEHGINLIRIPPIDFGVSVLWSGGALGSEFGLSTEDFVVEIGANVSF